MKMGWIIRKPLRKKKSCKIKIFLYFVRKGYFSKKCIKVGGD